MTNAEFNERYAAKREAYPLLAAETVERVNHEVFARVEHLAAGLDSTDDEVNEIFAIVIAEL